jgi:hypothetical protein
VVFSRYAGSAVENQSWSIDGAASPRDRRARRPASTPMVVVSSSYEATDRVPGIGGPPIVSAIRSRASRL